MPGGVDRAGSLELSSPQGPDQSQGGSSEEKGFWALRTRGPAACPGGSGQRVGGPAEGLALGASCQDGAAAEQQEDPKIFCQGHPKGTRWVPVR